MKMTKKQKGFIQRLMMLSVLVLSISLLSYASAGQGRGMNRGSNMPNFESFDINKDGYINEQELIEARSMRISSRIQQGYQMRNTANITPFQEIDTNSDGKISPDEFSVQQKQHQMGRQRPQ